MDSRVLVLFCLLTAVRSDEAPKKPEISVGEGNIDLKCERGTFADNQTTIRISYVSSGLHTCTSDEYAENLIQLDMRAVVTVLVSDVEVTIMIGWVIYSICAQPKTRSGYQGSKASDRVNLIENHSRSGGDTYQPLNTRAEEYSTLQARKHKHKQSV
uniref:Immunoglobulin V-set domain-containing protein n=1 Tax=Sinocyclocheilus anshuiensis TaxID=1608454 RepID=A0A671S0E4_9TELE